MKLICVSVFFLMLSSLQGSAGARERLADCKYAEKAQGLIYLKAMIEAADNKATKFFERVAAAKIKCESPTMAACSLFIANHFEIDFKGLQGELDLVKRSAAELSNGTDFLSYSACSQQLRNLFPKNSLDELKSELSAAEQRCCRKKK